MASISLGVLGDIELGHYNVLHRSKVFDYLFSFRLLLQVCIHLVLFTVNIMTKAKECEKGFY